MLLLAHASMEPPVALADFRDGKMTVWAPTKDPQTVQNGEPFLLSHRYSSSMRSTGQGIAAVEGSTLRDRPGIPNRLAPELNFSSIETRIMLSGMAEVLVPDRIGAHTLNPKPPAT